MKQRRTLIEARPPWRVTNWGELWRARDLFGFLAWRDIKALYKQTVLGFAWAIIRPLFSTVVFTIVFGRLAGVPSDGIPYPIFAYCGLLPWTYFSTVMSTSAGSLVGSANLLTKVYFPRILLPLVPVATKLVDLLIASSILAVLMVYYEVVPNRAILLVPFLLVLMALTATGIGIWLATLAIQYRDVKHMVQFGVQILLYASPVTWPASLVPDAYRPLYGLYPMAGVIEGFRSAVLGTTQVPWDLLIPGPAAALVIFISGLFFFGACERRFADVA